MSGGNEGDRLRVRDSQLDFGPDLVMHYGGESFAGISYEVRADGTRCELTYIAGFQDGPAASGMQRVAFELRRRG
jgi:hypothetical protein